MRFQCRCIEKICRNFVVASPIPLLSVSKAWSTINDVYHFGDLNEQIFRSARDGCFMIRFTAGAFQAFVQAAQHKEAETIWIVKAYRGHDSYIFGSTIEVRCVQETIARFSAICDVSHSYIQSRSSFDTPLVCDQYIAEFADKRMGAPALISWSPRCTVFRAVAQTIRNSALPLNNRQAVKSTSFSNPSSPSRATVSKGVIVLTPRSPQSQTNSLQSPSNTRSFKPYTYNYLLLARPSSFKQFTEGNDLMSQSGSKEEDDEDDEVPKPIFPVSCRTMIDEYSYYSSLYCISSSYMFSSLNSLRRLLSDNILNEICDLMNPIAKEAQDFELSFTDPENTGTNTYLDTVTSLDIYSEDDINADDIDAEPPLKQHENGCPDHKSSSENSSESDQAMVMAGKILNRIKNEGNMLLETDGVSQRDIDEVIPIGEEIEGKPEETAISRYIRTMPLHYPTLAIPCQDSKPHDYGQHLLRPSQSNTSNSKEQRASDSSEIPSRNRFEKIEDLVTYLCTLIAAKKYARNGQ